MKPLTLFVAAAACLAASSARAQFPNFPAANLVLGAPNFTTVSSTTATFSTMRAPAGVAIDPVSGKVFVSSPSQNRILRYANSASLASGASAEAVIGQANDTSETSGTSASKFFFPNGLHVDGSGRLWVADYINNRVLMFESAATLPTFGATANRVFGQPDFDTHTAGTSQTKMHGPTGVFVDAADNLWVAEFLNNRVLKFAAVSTLPSGSAATSVLGQPDFDTGFSAINAIKMHGPVAVVVDGTGRLWVAEQNSNRVLRFDNAASLANGAAANGVLGQPDFSTANSGTTVQTMNAATALVVDTAGMLYVSDLSNNRVLLFKNAAAKINGATADGVIGQPDFSTSTQGTTDRKLNEPFGGLALDAAGHLWVADTRNNRVLRFSPDTSAAAPTVGRVPKVTTKAKLTINGSAADESGIAAVRRRVGEGAFLGAIGLEAWTFKARLKPGKNTIEIVVVDWAGNISPPKRVKVTRR